MTAAAAMLKDGKVEDIYATMSSLVGGNMAAAPKPQQRTLGHNGMAGGFGGGMMGGGSMMGGGMGGGMGGYGGYGGGMGTGMGGYGTMGAIEPLASLGTSGTGAAGTTFNQRLRNLVGGKGGGTENQLLGDARIVPDDRSNSLIVFASKEDMQMITNIVSKVDRLLAQVLIEATVMNVNLSDQSSLGVSGLMNTKNTGKFANTAGVNNGQTFLSGITNSLAGGGMPGGFNYFVQHAGDMDVVVNALASSGKAQVLQTPRVQTSHAIPASFFTGETVPYVNGTMYGGYGYPGGATFSQLQVGVELDVTPYITPDGLVVMDIQQTLQDISGYTAITGVGNIPNTTLRTAQSTVSVQNGDTIILGGFIKTSKNITRTGVPILMDIPILGSLFSSTSHDNERSELIVLLRPIVLTTPHEAAELAKREEMRLPGVREMNKAMQEEEVKRTQKANRVTGMQP